MSKLEPTDNALQESRLDIYFYANSNHNTKLTHQGCTPYTTDYVFFLIMRSFKTIKVELFQLDPTPGFWLATPMIHTTIYKHNKTVKKQQTCTMA